MIRVSGNNIEMTRGDTFRGQISIFDVNGNPYICNENDVITFTLKKTYESNDVLIKKVINNTSLILEIEAEETKEFKMPSNYVYDIQLEKADGTVDTFIAKANLKITEEVG